MSLGPPIRKPAPAAPQPQDVQVSPHVWRRPDGTMYTKDMPPGDVAPRKRPAPAGDEDTTLDWGLAC